MERVPTANWIQLTQNTGQGNTPVLFTLAANTGATARTGTILIGERVATIEQAGAGGTCVARCATLRRGRRWPLRSRECRLPVAARADERGGSVHFAGHGGAAG
ncbi:MAG: hypothetical protein U0Y68_02490 [Blastocatellia bacterium]